MSRCLGDVEETRAPVPMRYARIALLLGSDAVAARLPAQTAAESLGTIATRGELIILALEPEVT